MAGGMVTRREFVAAALGVAACAGLGGCAGPSAVSGAGSFGGASGGSGSGADSAAEGWGLVSAGTLTVSAVTDSLPYFQEANGVRSGFACELLESIASRMGFDCAWSKTSSLESAVCRVNPGEQVRGAVVKADVAVTFSGADALRAAQGQAASVAGIGGAADDAGADGCFDAGFATVPYLRVSQCLVTKKSSALGGVDDIAGARVGVLSASPGQEWVAQNLPEASVVAYATLTELFSALQARNVDAVVADEQAANYYLRVAYGDEQVVQAIEGTEFDYVLLFDDDRSELAAAISGALDAMREDGSHQQLYDSWFAEADNSRGKTETRTPEQGAPGHDKGGAV